MNDTFQELCNQAERGDMVAQEKVATAYFKGKEIEKDIHRATYYFEKAAEQGSGLGNYQMGRAHETGTGASYDLQEAKRYYKKAATLGYQNAESKLKLMEAMDAQEEKKDVALGLQGNTYMPPKAPEIMEQLSKQKSKIVAVLLAFFLGAFGVHNFYLGYTKRGLLQLGLTFICVWFMGASISTIWAFVEMIMLLLGKISKDAKGVDLK